MIKKMKSDNKLQRILTLGRVKATLRDYFNSKDMKFKVPDERLVNGVLYKHLDLVKKED